MKPIRRVNTTWPCTALSDIDLRGSVERMSSKEQVTPAAEVVHVGVRGWHFGAGAGLAKWSPLGGFEEFREFLPNRASNSATWPANSAISASRSVNATCRSASSNCFLEGASGIGDHDGSTSKSTYLQGK
jgi:hypothetical protein